MQDISLLTDADEEENERYAERDQKRGHVKRLP